MPARCLPGDEEFYESLDRVLSSSGSSTSASDDDEDYGYLQQHSRRSCPSPPSNSTDVWLSDPASVEERRQRLFHQMGIGCDPELDWVKPDDEGSGVAREREMGRTASYDGLCPRPDPDRATSTAGVFARSRSDSSVKPRFLSRQHASVIGKPPLVGRLRTSLGGELEALDGDGRGSGEDAKSCTIKDLDNGKEFVVREFQEDGMRNKVREVGSERQLSMEEFDTCFGSSPIVQELMRRQNVEVIEKGSGVSSDRSKDGAESNGGGRSKRRSSWLKSLKNVVSAGNRQDRLSSEEKDTSSEKGGRRSSSATDDSQEAQDAPQSPLHGPERIKVRQYGKSLKELTGLFLTQEIQAHSGSIWTIKLSLNGRYLASAGEDYVVHVWQVSGYDRKLEILADRAGEENGDANFLAMTPTNVSPEEMLVMPYMETSQWDRKRREKGSGVGKYVSSDHMMVPEHIFALSERPVCSFIGHLDDVLDLSWSKSQYLLSSSMDKTVRLWHMSSSSCLKIFSHSDYVTCIQFNPFDDRYFISGSLDAKVRLWSIPDRQVVDWNDLREIITAACYTPDGQGALVGSNEGNCYLFDTSDNKLLQKSQVDLQNKKKKPSHKKITGFQFTPGCSWEALITSADSRIRVMDGNKITQKFKGFRNTSSQISASPTADGKYVICASEDSHVYLWRCDTGMRPSRSNSVINVSQSYEYFHCQGVTVAIPWPNAGLSSEEIFMPLDCKEENPNCISNPDDNSGNLVQASSKYSLLSPAYRCVDLDTSTLTKEKLCSPSGKHSRHSSGDLFNGGSNGHAWGMVIVTASLEGVIRIYQNYGLPVRV